MPETDDEASRCGVCEVRDWSTDEDGGLIPVWETPGDYEDGAPPDYIGCTECGTMKPFDADEVGAVDG